MDKHERDVDSLLAVAKEKESNYAWQEAAKCYVEALKRVSLEEPRTIGELDEALSHALYQAAFQADNPDEFRERMKRAATHYETAGHTYETLNDPLSMAKALRCRAMVQYIDFWSSADFGRKRKSVWSAWNIAQQALRGFDAPLAAKPFLETYNLLMMSGEAVLTDEEELPDLASGVAAFEALLDAGERAIRLNSEQGDRRALAEAYVSTAISLEEGALMFFESADRRKEGRLRARQYWLKANELSPEAAAIAETMAFQRLGLMYPFGMEQEEYLSFVEGVLPLRRKTGNKFLIGATFEELGCHFHFKIASAPYPEDRDAVSQRSMELALEATVQFSAIAHTSLLHHGFWSAEPGSGHYGTLAFFEPDLTKKRALAIKALETIPKSLRLAEAIGDAYVLGNVHYTYGIILTELAKTEPSPSKKADLLKDAMHHREISAKTCDRLTPLLLWNRGLAHFYVGDTKFELSKLADQRTHEIALVSEAVSEGKTALELIEKELGSWIEPPSASDLGMTAVMQHAYGTWLVRLWELEGGREPLLDAAGALERAAQAFQRAGMRCRNAETNWRVAQVYIDLEDHTKASEKFDRAAEQYNKATSEVPRLAEFYQDYALLMEAWSEIEKARHHHSRLEPALARAHFEKAAEIHGRTNSWSYLESNYLAWAEVEGAEDLSRGEKDNEAIDAFRQATDLFRESKEVMLERVAKIGSPDEKRMVEKLIEAADRRGSFCTARVALEEARHLDKQGNSAAALERYGRAADMFEKLRMGLTEERDRKELDLIISLAKAWYTMSRAEAVSSPETYEEAARLFDEARNLSPSDKMKNLAQGHGRFCRALAAGCRFSDSGDLAQHDIAADSLESAARFYLKAGLETTAEYARASRLLLDAYVQMGQASKETNHEKKARLYAMAEKILQASAASFDQAGQPGKRDQVKRILKSVRQDRELAVSLTEVLNAPEAIAEAVAIPSPTPTRETAAGLDRFEHAEVQATLIVRHRELQVGQDLNVEIELVNTGRGAAQLTKVDQIIPEGFDFVTEPEHSRIEDRHLNMRGKRLDAMNTEDVKIVIKPAARGTFTLCPRITYLDDTGRYRSSEPEPVEIRVSELGIVGWLKGSEKKR